MPLAVIVRAASKLEWGVSYAVEQALMERAQLHLPANCLLRRGS